MPNPTITAQRQHHRDDFTKQLRKTYPDPEDRVREQVEPMLDRWWPGTVEKHPEQEDES